MPEQSVLHTRNVVPDKKAILESLLQFRNMVPLLDSDTDERSGYSAIA